MKRLLAYLFIVLGLGLTFNVNAWSKTYSSPTEFIEEFNNKSLAIFMKDIDTNQEYKEASKLIENYFDIKAIGLYSLGDIRKSLNSIQIKKYNDSFKKYWIKSFYKNFFKILDYKIISKKIINKNYTLVTTLGNENIKIDWRVYTKDLNKLQIRDIVIEGYSLARTQKEEFQSILKKNNRDIKELIKQITNFSSTKKELIKVASATKGDLDGFMSALEKAKNAGLTIDADNTAKQFGYKDFDEFFIHYKSEYEIVDLSVDEAKEFLLGTDNTVDIVSQLKDLKDLLDSGALTNEEFEKAKKIVKVAKKEPKQEEFNKILKNIENSPIGDYYIFGHATTGEKFWGSTESINRTTTEGTTTSSSGRTCKIITKSKNKKMPFKGTFSLECPKMKVKGSWTQETATSPGIGQAFTNKGDVITAFFSSSRLEVKNFAKKFIDSQETQIAKKKTKQEEFKPKKTNQDNEAPIIEMAETITVNDTDYEFQGKVTDKAKTIYVEVDGRPTDVKNGQFIVKGYSPIDKEISITAIDQWGNRSEPKIVKLTIDVMNSSFAEVLEPLNASKIKSKSSNNKVALIIGIEQYEQSPKASYANLDAKYFFDYARKAFGVKNKNIKMLIDQEASLSKTNSAIFKWLPGKITANETDLIIFFSGHGLASSDGKAKYILPSNADPDLLSRTALSRSELFEEIIKLNPKSVTMFFDTCYSGVSRDEQTLLAAAKPLRGVVDDDNEVPDNFTIFTASKGDQISSGFKEAKHGIFSYYLMKGLEGKADANNDKDITNGELRTYMVKNVSDKALDLGRQQTPVLSGDPDKILMSYR